MEGNMKNQAGNIQEKGSSIAVREAPSIVEQVDGVEQVNSSIPLAGSSKKKGLGERISVHSRVSNVSYSFYKSLSSWIEKVKQHLSYNERKLLVLEEARKEAVGFFQKTIEEMGWEEYEKRSEETKGEKEGVISGENGEEGECEGEEEECENEGYLESSNAWIDELEELTGVKWVNGVLMEIKSYMDVVYDNEQWIHVEDIDAMALKACIILMEMDKADPSGGCLGPDTKLGCQLRANQERLGGKLCRWAWRAYGPGLPLLISPVLESMEVDLSDLELLELLSEKIAGVPTRILEVPFAYEYSPELLPHWMENVPYYYCFTDKSEIHFQADLRDPDLEELTVAPEDMDAPDFSREHPRNIAKRRRFE
nr:hypothetical protein Iba_chr15bCG11160 [Ipomoea batatas]